jgi:hypothetical protein
MKALRQVELIGMVPHYREKAGKAMPFLNAVGNQILLRLEEHAGEPYTVLRNVS